MTLLALHGITKAFGGRQILRGVDLELPDGARLGLVGPNGSGKSIVSHDRYFLDRMADRVVEVRDGGVRSWIGGYSEWLARRQPGEAALAVGGSIGS